MQRMHERVGCRCGSFAGLSRFISLCHGRKPFFLKTLPFHSFPKGFQDGGSVLLHVPAETDRQAAFPCRQGETVTPSAQVPSPSKFPLFQVKGKMSILTAHKTKQFRLLRFVPAADARSFSHEFPFVREVASALPVSEEKQSFPCASSCGTKTLHCPPFRGPDSRFGPRSRMFVPAYGSSASVSALASVASADTAGRRLFSESFPPVCAALAGVSV